MNETIKDRIGEPAMYEQLAEECTELSHACQKLARILRGENPTPARPEVVAKNINEELVDVILVASELGLNVDNELMAKKRNRWRERLEECKA